MEKLRKFKRSCLRACLHTYRDSEMKRFISNKRLYDKAQIPRIDNFIIKLSRDYFASLKEIDNKFTNQNSVLRPPSTLDRVNSGYLFPQDFIYLDKIGLIQDHKGIPIIHHVPRHRSNKKITHDRYMQTDSLKYNTKIPDFDYTDTHRLNKRYWWLMSDAVLLDELRRRSKRKKNNARNQR